MLDQISVEKLSQRLNHNLIKTKLRQFFINIELRKLLAKSFLSAKARETN